jgi:hypothetical protein
MGDADLLVEVEFTFVFVYLPSVLQNLLFAADATPIKLERW